LNSRDYGNRDGIDPVDCRHVAIENCTINSDDDCICPKSGSPAGVVDLKVKGCNLMSLRANGIKFGTASYGQFKDSSFEDVMIKHCGCAGIALESVDGAAITNITYKGIDMNQTQVPFYVIIGNRDTTPSGNPIKGAGSVDSILFQDIAAARQNSNIGSCISGVTISGTTHFINNLTFKRCSITFRGGVTKVPATPAEMGRQYPEYKVLKTMPAYGYFIRHARDVNFIDCSTTVSPEDVRPACILSDVVTR
jgi:polygalacturonase